LTITAKLSKPVVPTTPVASITLVKSENGQCHGSPTNVSWAVVVLAVVPLAVVPLAVVLAVLVSDILFPLFSQAPINSKTLN
jgi:hypothetical protein